MASKKWRLPQLYIDKLNDPDQSISSEYFSDLGTIQAIQFATTDGLAPNIVLNANNEIASSNLDSSESYIEINSVKYYFTYAFPNNMNTVVSGNELRVAYIGINAGNPSFTAYPALAITDSFIGIWVNYSISAGSIVTGNASYDYSPYRMIEQSLPYVSMIEVGSEEGTSESSGGTSEVIATPTVTAGKVVATLAVNPTQTPVRAMINGTEQDLPNGSIVKHSTTGQKFIKTSGSATSFTTIVTSPKSEWEWPTGGSLAWSILQNM